MNADEFQKRESVFISIHQWFQKVGMRIEVIFHGELKNYNDGQSVKSMSLSEGCTVGDLLARLEVRGEEIAFVAVNGSRVEPSQILQEGDRVKLYQFVGGG